MIRWSREKILIWGKTRPELSKTYGELVCTGGVLASTNELIRLYPIPLRYLNDEKIFSKYQFIEANIAKSPKDPRPESRIIDFNEILTLEKIGTEKGTWLSRRQWIMNEKNIVNSVEELQAHQKATRRSLGIIAPRLIKAVTFEQVSFERQDAWIKDYEAIYAKVDLPFADNDKRDIDPIPPPQFSYKVKFRCDDAACKQDHIFSILDWEVDALYNRLTLKGNGKTQAAEKVVEKLETSFSPKNDVRFFLGNISTHPQVFTIVGLWYPKKEMNRRLF